MSEHTDSRSFVLDGQGIPNSTSPQTIHSALQDAKTALGSAVLLACYQAFIQEFNTLSTAEQIESGLAPENFATAESILELPRIAPTNAIVANTHLYLTQLLRYIANIDPKELGKLQAAQKQIGVLGFSTGMFAATVIGCADSIPSLLSHAVEAFKLSFWIGFRAQQFVVRALDGVEIEEGLAAPWSLVTFSSTRSEVQKAIDLYISENPAKPKVYLTAVTHATCISVSGRPDALAVFKSSYLPSTASTSKYASIYTLYHSPELSEVKSQVMLDLERRGVRFPSYTDLQHPVRSTVTGKVIPAVKREDGYTLAEEVVDMTLLHAVNFDRVIDAIQSEFPSADGASVRFVNLGPGNVLWRSTARALPNVDLSLIDWSSATKAEATIPPQMTPVGSTNAVAREPIAIVGMAVKLPGAKDASGLWEVLEQGLNTVSEVPEARFNVSHYNSPDNTTKRTMKAKHGNFLDDAALFDNGFFHVSPRESRSMDPQQRLLLHVSHHALENAGYVPGATPTFNQDTFATYVGVATNDYVQNLRNSVDVYYATGTLPAFLSGKISYAFGFSGPSMVIDTACSSSMVAVYQACRALANGDCNAAIAGGVNVMSSPDMYLGLDRAHFLSATGQCKPWDASADGYCRSEGCGMFVLKRLSDAVAENDNILGVIRGIEVNQSANAESITHPHPPTQMDLFRKLVASTGIEPHRISVIEAHGTGTKAGDPTEIESIRSIFASGRSPENPLHLTSIKANIGHAEAASGAASLAKLLLMLRKRTIPAVISLKTLNPAIVDLAADGTTIDTALTAWEAPRGSEKRLCLLNNFGAAGSNAALILEEGSSPSGNSTAPAFIVGVSCESEASVEEQRAAYLKYIEENTADLSALTDFAYTATARRQTFRYRLAAVGKTKEELIASLRTAQALQVHENKGKVVFVFSGQGGQYSGMSATLYNSVPSFRQIVDQCHEKLVSWGFPGILSIINPAEGSPVDEDFRSFQSAVFVLEYALAAMWVSWGIKPDAVVGHSLGEYAALVAAGVLSLDDGLHLVAGRANLMGDKCVPNSTGMLAVKMSPANLTQYLQSNSSYDQLSIACYNSCDDGVVAGDISQLEKLQAELKQSGSKCARVNVPYGYHTSAMSPILEDITSLASGVKLNAPSIPVLSNVHGTVVSAGDASVFVPEYFARHCGEPVKFEQGIQELMQREEFSSVSAWIEIGPHPTSLPMLRSIPATSHQAMYLPSLRKNAGDWQTLCASLSSLYCIPNTLDWRKVYADLAPKARLTEIPAYPFAKTRYWVDFQEEAAPTSAPAAVTQPTLTPTRFSLVNFCKSLPAPGTTDVAVFETKVDTFAYLVEGHKVAGHGLCPASVYIEAASAAASLLLEHNQLMTRETVITLANITFSNPLVYSRDVPRTMKIEISLASPSEKHAGSWTISTYTTDPSKVQAHCSGVFDTPTKANTSSKLSLSSTMVERRKTQVMSPSGNSHPETFYTRIAYDVIFSRIVAYSSTYHTMKSITVDANGVDAYAIVQLPANTVKGTYVANPIFMDTLLHAAGFVINNNAGNNEAFICSQVDKVKAIPELFKPEAQYGVYCNIGFLSDTLAVADAYAFELGTPEVTIVAHMKRMRFRKLRMSGFQAILASAAGTTKHAAPQKALPQAAKAVVQKSSPVKAAPAPAPVNTGRVKEVMASVLGVAPSELAEDQDLERLGLDSLMSIEAHHALCAALDTTLPEDLFMTCKTVRDIQAAVGSSTPSVPSAPAGNSASSSDTEVTLHEPEPALASGEGRAESLEQVKEIMASVLGIATRDLAEDQDLERMGLDSLMSIEAHHALCTGLDITLPEDVFMTAKTIRELHDVISPPQAPKVVEQKSQKAESFSTFGTEINPVPLQTGGAPGALPLFLIHDGSGVAHPYSRISSLNRPVFGIHNPKFPTGGKWEGGLLEMASHYVSLIRKTLNGASGCLVGGWSIGGVIAFEVARQLIALGFNVPGLVLIDSPHPTTVAPLSDDVINAAFSTKASPSKAMELARIQIQFATRALVEYDPSHSPAKNIVPTKAVMLRSREGFPHVKKVDSQSDAFLAERRDPATMVVEWEQILGSKVPVLDIPGNHFEPFDPRHVGEVSQRLSEALSLLA